MDYEFSWLMVTLRNASNLILITFFTPIIAYSTSVLGVPQKKYYKLLLLHILLSFIVAILQRFLSSLIQNFIFSWLNERENTSIFNYWFLRSTVAGIVSSMIYYWLLYGIFLAAINQKKLFEKEKELANARLSALMTQLKPHFLFNTLNSIASLIDLDKKGAQKMISRFADLLRGVLDRQDQHFISLDKELEFIKNYLSIEQERYHDKLQIDYQIDDHTLAAQVPTLILQPIVENAIKHGIARKLSGGLIQISSAIIQNDTNDTTLLKITTEDNGQGLQEPVKFGIGLTNIHNRLKTLYPNNFILEINKRNPEGCIVTLMIPLKII